MPSWSDTAGQSYEESYELEEKAKPSRWSRTNDASRRKRQVGGAAAVGGVAGFILVGPVVAVAGAVGAAYAATSKGLAGSIFRGAGEGVATAGDGVKAVEDKTHVASKTKKGAVTSYKWISNKLSKKEEPR